MGCILSVHLWMASSSPRQLFTSPTLGRNLRGDYRIAPSSRAFLKLVRVRAYAGLMEIRTLSLNSCRLPEATVVDIVMEVLRTSMVSSSTLKVYIRSHITSVLLAFKSGIRVRKLNGLFSFITGLMHRAMVLV